MHRWQTRNPRQSRCGWRRSEAWGGKSQRIPPSFAASLFRSIAVQAPPPFRNDRRAGWTDPRLSYKEPRNAQRPMFAHRRRR
jgi:hypothetical protein